MAVTYQPLWDSMLNATLQVLDSGCHMHLQHERGKIISECMLVLAYTDRHAG